MNFRAPDCLLRSKVQSALEVSERLRLVAQDVQAEPQGWDSKLEFGRAAEVVGFIHESGFVR